MSKRIVPRDGSARPKAKKRPAGGAGTSPRVDPRRGSTLLHELSQPLTAIASFSAAAVRLAQAAPGLDARLVSAVAHIAQQVTRAAAVLEDLRALVSSPEGLPGTSESTSVTRMSPRQLLEAAEQEAVSRREATDQRLASSALDQTPEAIVVCDPRRRIIRASPGAQALCGRSPLMDAFEVAFPLRVAKPSTDGDLVPRALRGETVRALAAWLPRGDGSRAELIVSAGPLTQAANRLQGCVITLTDVTQLSEEKLRRVEAADRRKSEFLTRLSHELRNPLAPLRNSLYILQRAVPGDARAVRAQAVVDRQIQVLARLADDLLGVTRLARDQVELPGGTVDAQSEENLPGAVMSPRLPLASSPIERAEAPIKPRHRILIIEDNLDVAESLREALGFGHHEVEVAYSGPEGLAIARAQRPDVMLCDIGLPGMSGYEVARAFRADEALKGVFLVALSGYALREDLERAQLAGFDLHLAKPPNVEKLEALLAQVPSSEAQ